MKLEKIKVQKIYYIVLLLVVILTMGLSVYVGGTLVTDDILPSVDYSDGWQVTYADEKGTYDGVTGYMMVVEKTVTEDIKNEIKLGFMSYHQFVKVYADDEMIYSFGYSQKRHILKSPGNIFNIVNIDVCKTGSTIRIELITPYTRYNTYVPDFSLSYEMDFYYNSLSKCMMAIIVCVVLFFVGMLYILCWVIFAKRFGLNYSLIYLGTFAVLISIWSLQETEFYYLLPTNKEITSFVSFSSLMCLLIPITLFVKETYGSEFKQLLSGICLFNIIVEIGLYILQVLQIYDFVETIAVIHLIIIVTLIAIFYISIKEVYKTFKIRFIDMFSVLIIVLATTVVIDLIRYNMMIVDDSAFFTRFGLLAYVIGLGIINIKDTIHMIEIGIKAGQYEKMAYIDALTGAYSRAAYNEAIEKMNTDFTSRIKSGIVNFDINFLKLLNDQYGHDMGDKYIKASAAIIMDAFGECGRCYRIGGDEFIVIMNEFKKNKYYDAEVRMSKLIREFNSKKGSEEPALGISWGYAVRELHDISAEDIAKRADENMYKNKNINKKKVT